MARLTERTILVAGGTGGVGEGIVQELLARGARVLVQSRSAEALEALQTRLGASGQVEGVVADLQSMTGQDQLRATAARAGVSAAVSSLGGFWQGPPVRALPRETLDAVNDAGYLAHLALAQAVLPVLKGSNSALVQINGLAATLGIPGSSALCISAAAQLALTRCLIAESDAEGPRIASFLIGQLVRTRAMPQLPEGSLTAQEVGAVVADYLAAPSGHTIRRLDKAEGGVTTSEL